MLLKHDLKPLFLDLSYDALYFELVMAVRLGHMQIDIMLADYISKFSSLSDLFCRPIAHQLIRDPEIGYKLFERLSSCRFFLHWVSGCKKGLVCKYLSVFVAIEGFVLTVHSVGIDCPPYAWPGKHLISTIPSREWQDS